MINYPDHAGKLQPLGLIAEQATEIIRRDGRDFVEPGIEISAEHPTLGPVLMDERGVIQWVREQHLLPDRMRDLLFAETIEEEAS